jgi:hypothetical protein
LSNGFSSHRNVSCSRENNILKHFVILYPWNIDEPQKISPGRLKIVAFKNPCAENLVMRVFAESPIQRLVNYRLDKPGQILKGLAILW